LFGKKILIGKIFPVDFNSFFCFLQTGSSGSQGKKKIPKRNTKKKPAVNKSKETVLSVVELAPICFILINCSVYS
jgi:hypothetical protein